MDAIRLTRLIAFVFGISVFCNPALGDHDGSCHGDGLERAASIINEVQEGGIDLGRGADPNRILPRLMNLTTAAKSLPFACQKLVRKWTEDAIANPGVIGGPWVEGSPRNEGGPRCLAGVCCDANGCF